MLIVSFSNECQHANKRNKKAMKEPKNSCPHINWIQNELKRGIKELEFIECKGDDHESIELAIRFIDDAIDQMEDVRKINEELREYANYWRQEYDNQLREIADLERLVESLKDERDEIQERADELQEQMNALQLEEA